MLRQPWLLGLDTDNVMQVQIEVGKSMFLIFLPLPSFAICEAELVILFDRGRCNDLAECEATR